MERINFETGVKEYSLNDKCTVCFNPTDGAFVESLFNTFNELDKKNEKYRVEIEKTADKKEVFRIAREYDAELRGMIDGIFYDGLCNELFGSVSVFALAGGLPIWANLLLAIMDEVDTSFAREQKLTNPRISKYTAKYHR